MDYFVELVKFFSIIGPIVGLVYFGLSKVLKLYSSQIVMIVEIRENTRITNVAIEAMRMVDGETSGKIESQDRRLSDVENYLHLMTDPNISSHPNWQFKSRQNN